MSDRERLNSLRISLTRNQDIGLADLADAWHGHVARLVAEMTWTDDHGAWSEHDLVATLLTRDRIAALLPDVPSELRPMIEPAVAATDREFERYSDPDDCGCTERVYGEGPPPPGAWWWRRAPKSGPVLADLRRSYGHPTH